MDFRNLMVGGAALGVLAACWEHVKNFSWRLVGMVIRRVEIPSEAAHQALIAYLVAHYPRYRNYDSMYGADFEHHRDGRYGLVPYEVFGNRTVVFWNGWWPFLFSNAQEKKPRGGHQHQESSSGGPMKVFSTLTFLRGTLNIEEVLRNACAESNDLTWEASTTEEKAKNRFVIHHIPTRKEQEDDWDTGANGLPWYRQRYYRLLAHTPEQLGKAPLNEGGALNSLIFPQRIKDLIREIELWRNHREWYRTKGIPWKRGWMLYGPPGTGKTALARAFAEDLNMPIYVFNLAQMSNHESDEGVDRHASERAVHRADRGHRQRVPRPGERGAEALADAHDVPAAEDDDEGQNAPPPTPLTFDCLLNCLDGVERSGRDLHDHHDQRHQQDRRGAGPAATAARREVSSSSPPGRAGSTRRWS